jgi:TolA-binding protein
MPTLDSINSLLGEAAEKLDQAAREVRDAPLEPTKEHIHRIGEALANIFHVQHQIYESRPDLKPPHLDQELKEPEANRALGEAMVKADALVDSGKVTEAIQVMESFISAYPNSELCSIAEGEIERYKGVGT